MSAYNLVHDDDVYCCVAKDDDEMNGDDWSPPLYDVDVYCCVTKDDDDMNADA